MKPYKELNTKGKTMRLTIAKVLVYGILLLVFYFACARLYRTINKVRTPVIREKNLPIASILIST